MENKIVKEFEVDVVWYELHGGKVAVKAESKEEASRMVKNNFEKFRNELKNQDKETCRGVSYSMSEEFESREKEVEMDEVKLTDKKMYEDRFDTDVYVVGTGYSNRGSLFNIERVIYKDYLPNEEFSYVFGRGDFDNYYNFGYCSQRRRNGVLFDKGDFRKVLLRKIEEKHNLASEWDRIDKNMIAKNIDEATSGGYYAFVVKTYIPKNSIKPRSIEVCAVKIEEYSSRVPYRMNIGQNAYLNFSSKEKLEDTILMNKKFKCGNEECFIFLNSPEHISILERMVEEFALNEL